MVVKVTGLPYGRLSSFCKANARAERAFVGVDGGPDLLVAAADPAAAVPRPVLFVLSDAPPPPLAPAPEGIAGYIDVDQRRGDI